MITFSDKQLKTPEMMRPVYLVTGGLSKFAQDDTPARSRFKRKQREA